MDNSLLRFRVDIDHAIRRLRVDFVGAAAGDAETDRRSDRYEDSLRSHCRFFHANILEQRQSLVVL